MIDVFTIGTVCTACGDEQQWEPDKVPAGCACGGVLDVYELDARRVRQEPSSRQSRQQGIQGGVPSPGTRDHGLG